MATQSFADGSTLPEYVSGESLHRAGERRVVHGEHSSVPLDTLPDVELRGTGATYRGRVHVSATNDAEALADIWGTLVDREPLTSAIVARFIAFVGATFGEDAVEILTARSSARFYGAEPVNHEHEEDATVNRYAFGHTGV
jgi:hypothetical protein